MRDAQAIQEKLTAGLQAMGLVIAPEKIAQLIAYVLLIEKWNKVHNLTAIRDPLEMVTLHILDSLSVLKMLVAQNPKCVLDVGAGAGLPSIPLAICLPEMQFAAIDAVQKKASFMRQAKAELGLNNFLVEAGRVEQLKKEKFQQGLGVDVIVSRAFSEIALFANLTRHLLVEGGCWFAMKGVVPHDELEKAEFKKLGVLVEKVEPLFVPALNAERHLVVLKVN
jgi:16S rRNA (guanine527-N7)-methyltransferase